VNPGETLVLGQPHSRAEAIPAELGIDAAAKLAVVDEQRAVVDRIVVVGHSRLSVRHFSS
jgi:hypothetical protein